VTVSYQACRWYDTHPRLAFALKLMYLAPQTVRESVTHKLMRFLDQQLDPVLGRTVVTASVTITGNRWYDQSAQTAVAFERLRRSPDLIKQQSAEALLTYLSE
jgi:hypothetical protein